MTSLKQFCDSRLEVLEQQEKYEFIWLLMIKEGTVSVKVLETRDHWFGVTYAEDKDSVADSFKKLVSDGVYQSPLW